MSVGKALDLSIRNETRKQLLGVAPLKRLVSRGFFDLLRTLAAHNVPSREVAPSAPQMTSALTTKKKNVAP
jgi:hypothetical protein